LAAAVISLLLTACGGGGGDGGDKDTTNGKISANVSSLNFSGASPATQQISISYVTPPVQVVLGGFPPNDPNPTCSGINPTCRLNFTLVSLNTANPLVFEVSILDTASAHTSRLRFVATDLGYQTNYGYIDVPVRYTP
jgi:hypothetical protein